MFVGKVIGTVWSTVKWPETRGLKLLLVRPYHLGDLLAREDDSQPDPSAQSATPPRSQSGPDAQLPSLNDSEAVVCADLLDAGVGDDVVVAFGHAARVAAQETGAYAASSRPSSRPTSESSSGSRGSAPSSSGAPPAAPTVAPIDAAIVAIVDRIGLARPGT